MRKNLFLTRGTLGLALAASVFLGCQDFLGGSENGTASSPTPASTLSSPSTPSSASDANVQHLAQIAVSLDSAKVTPTRLEAFTEPEKSSPLPASPTTLTPEQQACLDLYHQLDVANGNYMEIKNQYGQQNCDAVLGKAKPTPPPAPPMTIEERCRLYRLNLTQTQPTGDPKYAAHMAEMAITCAAYP